MYSLIFYCGLISSVVSAHFNNDTLHDGDEHDINTTLSTLASTTIPVSKDCVLEMKENEISQIVELFNSNLLNMVVFDFLFSNTSGFNILVMDLRVSLSNPFGKEILNALGKGNINYVAWTLKAGIRNFKVHVSGSPIYCTKWSLAFKSTQNIVNRLKMATNYEVCISYFEIYFTFLPRICCPITTPYLPLKLSVCYLKENQPVFGSEILWAVIYVIIALFVYFYLMWLLSAFRSRTLFNLKYPEYCKLAESTMSPSSVVFKITFEENGRTISLIRTSVLICVLSYFCYLFVGLNVLLIWSMPLFVSWVVFFFAFVRPRSKITKASYLKFIDKMDELPLKFLVWFQGNTLRPKVKSGQFENVVEILTLVFNVKFWRRKIVMLYDKCRIFFTYIHRPFKNRVLKKLALCISSVFAVLICFFYVFILLFFLVILICVFPMFYLLISLSVFSYSEYTFGNACSVNVRLTFRVLTIIHFLMFLVLSIPPAVSSIMFFLLGLFLNLVHFIPYFAFFSVLTFYCCTYWKTMEEKYFVLKRLIYEECRKIQYVNNGCIPNRNPKPNEKVLPVVSKELYDKIREVMLPYHTNLFYFVLKMFWSIAFSSGIFMLMYMLSKFHVGALFQIVITASLGVMPHVFNMLVLKANEERKKAWNEKLKLNVKYMVEELIREDRELARTVLIIEQDDGEIHYSPQFTLLKVLLDWKHSVSGVEDDGLSQIAVGQEDNHMIAGEDVQEVIEMLEIDLNDRTYLM